jgi:hypothetical protein
MKKNHHGLQKLAVAVVSWFSLPPISIAMMAKDRLT